MINSILTSTYARAIYIFGTKRFTARDGKLGIPTEYHEPVKKYAATGIVNDVHYPDDDFVGYELTQIQQALTKGYINQTEYDETVAYIV